GKTRQDGQCRTRAAEARTRHLYDPDRIRSQIAGPAGHRPHRVLGPDQPRYPAGAADEGRFRRRAVTVPAGAQGGAVRSRLGAEITAEARAAAERLLRAATA